MNEKLTIADAMKYPNAMLIRTYPAEKTETYFNTKNYNNIFNFIVEVGSISRTLIYDCELILRPLESLTKEERDSMENILGQAGMFTKITRRGHTIHNKQIEVMDYLRSINIDIDGFIEAGKAVAE